DISTRRHHGQLQPIRLSDYGNQSAWYQCRQGLECGEPLVPPATAAMGYRTPRARRVGTGGIHIQWRSHSDRDSEHFHWVPAINGRLLPPPRPHRHCRSRRRYRIPLPCGVSSARSTDPLHTLDGTALYSLVVNGRTQGWRGAPLPALSEFPQLVAQDTVLAITALKRRYEKLPEAGSPLCRELFYLLQFFPALRQQARIAAVVHLHSATCAVDEQQIPTPDRHWESARRVLTEDFCFASEFAMERLINAYPIQRAIVELLVRRRNEAFGPNSSQNHRLRSPVFLGNRRMAVQADCVNRGRGQP